MKRSITKEQALKKAELDKRWIDGYEHNLNLYIDTYKDELSELSSERNLQFSNAKTLLWFNIVLIGLSMKLFEYNYSIILILPFFITTSLSILFSLIGMIEGKHHAYVSLGRSSKLSEHENNEWIKTQGLLTVSYAYRRAIKYNGISIIRRAKWLRLSKYVSVIAFCFFVGFSTYTSNFMKGGDKMAEKPSNIPTVPKKTPAERFKRTADNTTKSTSIIKKPANDKK